MLNIAQGNIFRMCVCVLTGRYKSFNEKCGKLTGKSVKEHGS